ncbi:hypothetical protein WR25_23437 [Diploscapter pachys]|uniref:CHK kinase-like domain-containing protein n=1 Tax=Diploscapter pachys TaxID=2018661 RepID=A0A2A2JMT3_9BILA|nr:hypothetical protein WR25_23437 [Diploscapter pachys]
MSLLDLGTGIMQTHVSWKDIEDKIKEQMGVDLKFDEDHTKLEEIGEKKGFLSRIIKVQSVFKSGECDELKTFVLKVCSLTNTKSMAETMQNGMELDEKRKAEFEEGFAKFEIQAKKFHNKEVDFLELFSKVKDDKMKLSKIFFSRKFTETSNIGFIGMELVNGISFPIYENFAVDEVEQVLKGLAAINAQSIMMPEDKSAIIQGNSLAEVQQAMMKEDMMNNMLDLIGNVLPDPEIKEGVEEVKKLIVHLLDMSRLDTVPKELNIGNAWVHGDLWNANLLWQLDENKHKKLVKIIDFQITHFGCPTEDMVRFFICGLSGKDRQEKWEYLVERYYSYLKELLHGEEPPFSLENLKKSYEQLFVTCGTLILPAFGAVIGQQVQSDLPEEEKTLIFDALKEKLMALLKDFLHYYDIYHRK